MSLRYTSGVIIQDVCVCMNIKGKERYEKDTRHHSYASTDNEVSVRKPFVLAQVPSLMYQPPALPRRKGSFF